jgi:hypothetical protein
MLIEGLSRGSNFRDGIFMIATGGTGGDIQGALEVDEVSSRG